MISILIAEDNRLIRISIRRMLEKLPFEVCVVGEAEDGEDAFYQYRELTPDIIITDIEMPIMGGLRLLETVRKEDKRTQFIVISGYEDFAYAQKALKSGVARYIVKPVKEKELEEAVRYCAQYLGE